MYHLRPYQQKIVDAVLASNASGCIVAPTGSGKTVIMAALYAAVPNTIIVCWELTVRQQLLDRHGIKAYSPNALPASDSRPSLVIIDEVHHYSEDHAWGKVLSIGERWLGFTATPCNGLPILHALSYDELRDGGFIAPPVSGVLCSSIDEAIAATNDLYTVTYISRTSDYNPRFGRLILADTPSEERAFFPADNKRLCCIATLSTGWDNADIEAVILARHICEPQTYVQILGRLRRGGVVADLSNNIIRFGIDEDAIIADMSASTAGGGDGEGIPVLTRCVECERLISPRLSICPYCGTALPPSPTAARHVIWQEIDYNAWEKAFSKLDWQCRKSCPFTPSGAWPYKIDGQQVYFSSRTYDHWNAVRNIFRRCNGVVIYGIDTHWMVRRNDKYYVIDIAYNSPLRWIVY